MVWEFENDNFSIVTFSFAARYSQGSHYSLLSFVLLWYFSLDNAVLGGKYRSQFSLWVRCFQQAGPVKK